VFVNLTLTAAVTAA